MTYVLASFGILMCVVSLFMITRSYNKYHKIGWIGYAIANAYGVAENAYLHTWTQMPRTKQDWIADVIGYMICAIALAFWLYGTYDNRKELRKHV